MSATTTISEHTLWLEKMKLEECDHGNCPALAKWEVRFLSGQRLYFCMHHKNSLEPSLLVKWQPIQRFGWEEEK